MQKIYDVYVSFQIGDIDIEVSLPIQKADRRYFPLYRDTNKEPWGIISHVRNVYGSTVITVHGVLKVSFSIYPNSQRKRNIYQIYCN